MITIPLEARCPECKCPSDQKCDGLLSKRIIDELYPEGQITLEPCTARVKLLKAYEAQKFWDRSGLREPPLAAPEALPLPALWIGSIESLLPSIKERLKVGKRVEVLWIDNVGQCRHRLPEIAPANPLPLLVLLNYQGGARLGFLWNDLYSLLIRYKQSQRPFIIQAPHKVEVPVAFSMWYTFDAEIVTPLPILEGVDS